MSSMTFKGEARGLAMRLGAVAAVSAALVLGGCTADYVTGSRAPVLLLIENINGGAPLLSDVRGDTGQIFNCISPVTVRNQLKNPTAVATKVEDVQLTTYEVRYRRSDGRAVEGVDVPYRITGSLSAVVPSGGSATVSIDVVRHQAKIEPPLIDITGLAIVTMMADISFSGTTIAQQTVSASATTNITFADFATGTKTCEGQ